MADQINCRHLDDSVHCTCLYILHKGVNVSYIAPAYIYCTSVSICHILHLHIYTAQACQCVIYCTCIYILYKRVNVSYIAPANIYCTSMSMLYILHLHIYTAQACQCVIYCTCIYVLHKSVNVSLRRLYMQWQGLL